MVVLVSGVVTYKLFFSESFTFKSVVKKFMNNYAAKGNDEELKDIAKRDDVITDNIAGEFGAKLTDMIIARRAP